MRVPVITSPSVAPGVNPDVRVNLQNVGAGAQAIGQGLQKLGGGLDQLGGDIEEYQRRRASRDAHTAAMNALTQQAKNKNAILEGIVTQTPVPGKEPPGDPLLAAGGGPLSTFVARNLAYADNDATHEQPSGPSHSVVESLSDPDSGLFPGGYNNTKGMAAQKHAHATMDALSASIDDIAKGLPSDRAREIFREEALRDLEVTRGQVERHSAQQTEIAHQLALQGNIASSFPEIQRGADFAGPGGAAQAIGDAQFAMAPREKAIWEMATTPEEGEAQVMAYRQEAFGGLVNRYIDAKDAKSAQLVLDKQADALRWGKDGERRYAAWKETVDKLKAKGDADDLSNSILQNSLKSSGLYDTAQAFSDFTKLPPEQQTTEARQKVAAAISFANESNRAIASKKFDDAKTQYMEADHHISGLHADTFAWLVRHDPDGLRTIEGWDERDNKPPKVGKHVDTPEEIATAKQQDDIYSQFMQDTSANPDLVRKLPPGQITRDFGGLVRPKQLAAMNAHAAVILGKKPENVTTLPVETQRMITREMDGHGLNPKGKANGPVRTQIDSGMLDFYDSWKKAHREDPPPAKVEEELAKQFQKVKVPGIIFDTNTTRAQFEAESGADRSKATIEATPGKFVPLDQYEQFEKDKAAAAKPADISELDRIHIRQALQRKGKPSTEEDIQRVYRQGTAPKPAAAPAAPTSSEPNMSVQPPPRPTPTSTAAESQASLTHPNNAAIIEKAAPNKARAGIMKAADWLMGKLGSQSELADKMVAKRAEKRDAEIADIKL